MTLEHVPLSELLTLERRKVTVHPERQYAEVGVYCFGRGLFHKEPRSGLEVGNKPLFELRDRDFILQVTFAWEGAVALARKSDEGYLGSVRVLTFRVDEHLCLPEYLVLYFKTPEGIEQLGRISPGSAGRNRVLSHRRMSEVTVPLPPLAHQRLVVDKVKELTAKIEEVRKLKQSLVGSADIFFLSCIENVVSDLAESFPIEPLIDLVEQKRGISYGIVQTGEPYEGGIPTLRAGNLGQFAVKTVGVKPVHPEIEAKYQRTRLQGNEVLLRIRGGFGEVAVCPPEITGGNVSREIAVIPLTTLMLPHYVMFAIAAPSSQEFLRKHVRGTSYVGINLHDVRRLPIPVPPLEEQYRIVAQLEGLYAKVKHLKSVQTQTVAELDAFLPSLLDKAFRGGM
jgi:type I restriction enzyme, S subunit